MLERARRTFPLAAALCLSACTGNHPSPAPPDLADAQAAMLPARLIIHPLTRLGADAQGRPALLAHIELRDRFDLNTRALGTFRVSVQRPGLDTIMAAADPTLTLPGDQAWDVDLRDPERNATLYDDLVTRTYSLTLAGPPPWLLDWSAGRAQSILSAGPPTVTATFTFPDPHASGGEKTLTDSARLLR